MYEVIRRKNNNKRRREADVQTVDHGTRGLQSAVLPSKDRVRLLDSFDAEASQTREPFIEAFA
jgi:hypothetical protein